MVASPARDPGIKDEGVVMKRVIGAIRSRIGPVGLSLAAAALTAVGFAAISVADNGNGGGGSNDKGEVMWSAGPPGGGAGLMFRDRLSDEDRQKLEDFRQCMEDNGAPAPPEPGEFDPSDGPPKPPSEAEMEKMKQAFEACEDKLPADIQKAGPPHLGVGPDCGPPPGAPGTEQKGKNQNQSNDSNSSSSGASS
jgi:hypothetical protein